MGGSGDTKEAFCVSNIDLHFMNASPILVHWLQYYDEGVIELYGGSVFSHPYEMLKLGCSPYHYHHHDQYRYHTSSHPYRTSFILGIYKRSKSGWKLDLVWTQKQTWVISASLDTNFGRTSQSASRHGLSPCLVQTRVDS